MDTDAQIPYSTHPEFNDWLDSDDNNIVNIQGYSFPPSEVLYNLNYEQYVEALDEYLNDENVLIQEVYSDFPTPIAYYFFQAEENYDNPHHRLELLKSTWEALIFVIYGIAISEARHRGLQLHDVGVNLKDYYSNRLAQKLRIIEGLISYCQTNSYHLKIQSIIPLEAIYKIRELNNSRNEFAHTFARTPERQKEVYNSLKPELVQVFREVRNLKSVNLFRYHSTEASPLHPRCDIFNGHSLNGAKKILIINKDDYSQVMEYFNRDYLFVHIEEEIFCAAPFIHFRMESGDIHPVILFLKERASGSKYRFEIVSRSEEIELDQSLFGRRDQELRDLVL